jgi:uncharacterized protein
MRGIRLARTRCARVGIGVGTTRTDECERTMVLRLADRHNLAGAGGWTAICRSGGCVWEGGMGADSGTCTSCGACCVAYRVAFLRHELDSEPGGWVPVAFSEAINDRCVCMRGTKNRPRRCLALRGTIGVEVSCAIYQHRPSPCRAFAPAAGAGRGDRACGDARRLHRMPPLTGSYDGFPIA